MDATCYITAWNALVKTFLGVFTQPTGRVFARLLVGGILCTGRHTVTGILRQADPEKPAELIYRVLSPYIVADGKVEARAAGGVVEAAVDRRESILVPHVHAFPGHIPCDRRSRSELVVPLFGPDGEPVGVLDIDSHQAG